MMSELTHCFEIPGVEGTDVHILMPFSVGWNQHSHWVERQNLEWLLGLGVINAKGQEFEIVTKAAFHRLAALVHHDDDRNALALVANFISFLFFFDDMVDSATSEIGTNARLTREVADRMMLGVHGQPAITEDSNAVLAVTYIPLLLKEYGDAGQLGLDRMSYPVAWFKLLASVTGSVFCLLHLSDKHWLHVVCFVVILVDVYYLYLFRYLRSLAPHVAQEQ